MTAAPRRLRPATADAAPPARDARELARLAARVAHAHTGLDIRVLEMGPLLEITDYFVLVTGTNRRQIRAIAGAIQEELRGRGVAPHHVDGLASAVWVLADYGDFVVHVFTEEARRYYDLDGLWADARRVPWEETPSPGRTRGSGGTGEPE